MKRWGMAMKAVLRLALLLGLLAGIAFLVKDRASGTPVTLAAGGLLLAGVFAGKLAESFRLPKLTGYLLIGVAIGPYVLKLLPIEGVKGLDLVEGVAVSLIGLAAGCEMKLHLLKRVGLTAAKHGAQVAGATFLVCFGVLVGLRPHLGFFAGMSWPQVLAVSALVASVVMSFSPTVTIAIVQESRARGSFTEFLMAVVIVGDLLVILCFAVLAGVTHAVFGGKLAFGVLLGGVGKEVFGSLLFGIALGAILLLYLKRWGKELPLFLCALGFTVAALSKELHLSALLITLTAGALVSNLDEREGELTAVAIERAGLPIFALFFAAIGAKLNITTLRVLYRLALLLAVVRLATIYGASRWLAPKEDPKVKKLTWMGLVSQAGVTLALIPLLAENFPRFGAKLAVLLVALVAIHLLIGPVLSRRALAQAGEIGRDIRLG